MPLERRSYREPETIVLVLVVEQFQVEIVISTDGDGHSSNQQTANGYL